MVKFVVRLMLLVGVLVVCSPPNARADNCQFCENQASECWNNAYDQCVAGGWQNSTWCNNWANNEWSRCYCECYTYYCNPWGLCTGG